MLCKRLLPVVCLLGACSSAPDNPTADATPSRTDARANQPDANPNQPDANPNQPDARTLDGVDCAFNTSIQWSLEAETFQLESADGTACVYLARTNECPDGWICKAVPFSIQEARIGAERQTRVQTETAFMMWEPTHHNWYDYGLFTIGATTYRLDSVFGVNGAPIYYELTATGDRTWGPIRLDPVNPR